MKDTRQIKIINGPKVNELIDSFASTYNKGGSKPAEFVVLMDDIYFILKVGLVSLEYEDGSGERFNLHGRALPGGFSISAYYNAVLKSGAMELTT